MSDPFTPLLSSQIGSQNDQPRTRSRAGTLPLRFNQGAPFAMPPAGPAISAAGSSMPPANSSSSTVPLPALTPYALGEPSQGRLRSGLMMLTLTGTTLIWNDPPPMENGTSHRSLIIPSDVFLDATPVATPPAGDMYAANRPRLYTANFAFPQDLPQFHLPPSDYGFGRDLSQQQFLAMPGGDYMPQVSAGAAAAAAAAAAQVFRDQNRPRASTYTTGFGGPSPHAHMEPVPMPLVLDQVDRRSCPFVLLFQNPTMGPTNTLVLVNLPPPLASCNPMTLHHLFAKFGVVVLLRLGTNNEFCLVQYQLVEQTMLAKASVTHQELMPGYPCIVAFAQVMDPVPQHPSPPGVATGTVPAPQQVLPTQELPPQRGHLLSDPGAAPLAEAPRVEQLQESILRSATVLASLSGLEQAHARHVMQHAVTQLRACTTLLGQQPKSGARLFDAPKLREIRKGIDSGSLKKHEIEELAFAMLDELPELLSDYLGNTVVQKLFEHCSDTAKTCMVRVVAPYILQMAAHKNGTWAAQKMIAVANTPLQKEMIARALAPHAVALFNDQFGNYALQGCLRFGVPYNDFVFAAVLADFMRILQGRFGARLVRACLEASDTRPEQLVLVAACVAEHTEWLASDANGALLLTWLLDTSGLAHRHDVVVPHLLPHLARFGTHKLAGLAVLKVINHRGAALTQLLEALFGVSPDARGFPEQHPIPPVLEQVCSDAAHGANFVFKVLVLPALEGEYRRFCVAMVRNTLLALNVLGFHGYKRLMEEVGLSVRPEAQRLRQPSFAPRRSTGLGLLLALNPRYTAPLPGFGLYPPGLEPQGLYFAPPTQLDNDHAIMQHLEQLLLLLAALGYSVPGLPSGGYAQ